MHNLMTIMSACHPACLHTPEGCLELTLARSAQAGGQHAAAQLPQGLPPSMAAYTLQPTSLPTNNSSENKLLSTFLHAGSDNAQQVTTCQM